MFTKKDLRSGDVCIRRNGDRRIYIDTGEFRVLVGFPYKVDFYNGKQCFLCHAGEEAERGEWDCLDNLSEDLRCSDVCVMLDIVKVFRPTRAEAVINTFIADLEKNDLFDLVFDRNAPAEMTLAEVCEALGKNIKIVKEHIL